MKSAQVEFRRIERENIDHNTLDLIVGCEMERILPPPGLLSRAAVRCRGSLHGRLITSVSRRCGLVLVRIDTDNALMVANQLRVAPGSTIM